MGQHETVTDAGMGYAVREHRVELHTTVEPMTGEHGGDAVVLGEVARRRGRPPTSSPEAIEAVAMELFARQGLEVTTIVQIAAAAGLSKTSFFRYFPSKTSIVSWRLQTHVACLHRLLRDSADSPEPTMVLAHRAVLGALEEVIDDRGLWVSSLSVLEQAGGLQYLETSGLWANWREHVAGFIADRHGVDAFDVVPQAFAGAVQAAVLCLLRSWLTGQSDHLAAGTIAGGDATTEDAAREAAGDLLRRVERGLRPLQDVLQLLLPSTASATLHREGAATLGML